VNPDGVILDLGRQALATIAFAAAPFIATALIFGIVVAFVQAATQLQDNAVSTVPRIAAVGAVLYVGGPLVLDYLVRFATSALHLLAVIGAGGVR
jgi:flagellar biosynthetic protein FliQ